MKSNKTQLFFQALIAAIALGFALLFGNAKASENEIIS